MKDDKFASCFVERQRKKQITKGLLDVFGKLTPEDEISSEKTAHKDDDIIVSIFGKEGDGMSIIALKKYQKR